MREQLATPDVLVARIAGNQHGVIHFEQLLRCGLTKDSVRWRVKTGRLHPVYRGVYAVGHLPVSRRGYFKACAGRSARPAT